LNVVNPAGATSAQFQFEMADAGNDWWWAVDNLLVKGTVPEPSGAALLGFGLAALARRTRKHPPTDAPGRD
jgi:hypothetical protein